MRMMNRHNNFNWNGIESIISIEGCLSRNKFFDHEPSNPSSNR